ncbi:DUF4148 domain-containing protein [Paraburkholderia fungorum]|uniref:DUF4148 domain-containing protein n=1 Tax=Paraburkholderia fungorum TaxID=134537 RepID=UPI0016039354|nr:DUF4148 domain-containing protein [Paraburkholderia fungorum]
MKRITLFKQSVFATMLLSATVTAFAAGGQANGLGHNPNPYAVSATGAASRSQETALASNRNPAAKVPERAADGTANVTGSAGYGKTRAQVRAELLQAQRAGLAPVHKNDYPPSAETIARNRTRFQQIEQAWHAGDQVTASEQ